MYIREVISSVVKMIGADTGKQETETDRRGRTYDTVYSSMQLICNG